MDRNELNNAIFNVLYYQFKKDCKVSHDIVEQAGYKISKFNGHFNIKNEATDRCVWIEHGSYTSYIKRFSNSNKDVRIEGYTFSCTKFDFVGYLEKPRNEVWWDIINSDYYGLGRRGTGYWKRERLRTAKNSVKYRKEDIEKIKGQIAKLQEALEKEIRYEIEAEYKLEEVRKELGLVKED